MSIAIAILAHGQLNRTAHLVKHLSQSGFNVCVHVDAKLPASAFAKFCKTIPNEVVTLKRQNCDWGKFSLVEAELRLCERILKDWPETSHIQLISGDCLPIQSAHQISEFLATHPDTDFIESFAVNENNWVTGGLGIERFTLHFPFSWKTQRWLFDRWVDLQRLFRISRKIPDQLSPHIGSQWWCLTRNTVTAILSDPRKEAYDKFFGKSWIPDESYFQTLVRKHAKKINSKSLVYSKFDHQGKPTIFYDDHLPHLAALNTHYIRKVWNGADGLYKSLLSSDNWRAKVDPTQAPIGELISHANQRRKTGRDGLRMQGRNPNKWYEPHVKTANSSNVYIGLQHILDDFSKWRAKFDRAEGLGYIFSKGAVEFPDGDAFGPGGNTSNPNVRDVSPSCFYSNLGWQYRKNGMSYLFDVESEKRHRELVVSDQNANLYHIKYAWLIKLIEQNIDNDALLVRRASEHIAAEAKFVQLAKSKKSNCAYHSWNLADFYRDPHTVLTEISEGLTGEVLSGPLLLPQLRRFDALAEFVTRLIDNGVDLDRDKVVGYPITAQSIPLAQINYD